MVNLATAIVAIETYSVFVKPVEDVISTLLFASMMHQTPRESSFAIEGNSLASYDSDDDDDDDYDVSYTWHIISPGQSSSTPLES